MPNLNVNAIVSSSVAGAAYGANYTYLTEEEASDGLTVKVTSVDTGVWTIGSGIADPAVMVLNNLGLVTDTDDASRITWGFVLDATTTHLFELFAGDSHVVRINRDIVPSISIFAKTEFLPGGSVAADMWLDVKVWDK